MYGEMMDEYGEGILQYSESHNLADNFDFYSWLGEQTNWMGDSVQRYDQASDHQ